MSISFRELANLVTCREFAERTLEIKNNRIRCPFRDGHAGRDYNMAFTPDGHAHCFVCHRTADVVQLAAAVWNVGQVEAAAELNTMFNLGLDRKTATEADKERWRQDRQRRDDKHQAAVDAVEDAREEAKRAWEAVKAAGPDSAEYDELRHQAENADVWTSFKLMELQLMTAAAGRC